MKLRDKEKEVRHLEKALGKEESKTLWVKGRMKAYQKSSTTDSSAHTFSMWPSKEREREKECVWVTSQLCLSISALCRTLADVSSAACQPFQSARGPAPEWGGKPQTFTYPATLTQFTVNLELYHLKTLQRNKPKKQGSLLLSVDSFLT